MPENTNPSVPGARTLTRRRIALAAVLLGVLGTICAGAWARVAAHSVKSPGIAVNDASTTIHQEIDFNASPSRVYEALLDAKQFSAFTGVPAEIHREAGGAFSAFGGQIVGRNLELVPNRRIVQAWRSNGWPEGSYSIVKFELTEQAGGTRLTMDHRGFPDGQREHLETGWKEHYWDPLAKYLH